MFFLSYCFSWHLVRLFFFFFSITFFFFHIFLSRVNCWYELDQHSVMILLSGQPNETVNFFDLFICNYLYLCLFSFSIKKKQQHDSILIYDTDGIFKVYLRINTRLFIIFISMIWRNGNKNNVKLGTKEKKQKHMTSKRKYTKRNVHHI